MKVSSSEEYGLRCLLQLARAHPGGRDLSLHEIATREGMPTPNTAKLLRRLRMAGIVASARGRSGGYSLARAPEQITLAEALSALDGPMFEQTRDCTTYTGRETVCVNTGDCAVRSLWRTLDELVQGALAKITLADLDSSEQRSRLKFETTWEPAKESELTRVSAHGRPGPDEAWEV